MSVYNGLALTRACLDSFRASTEPFHLAVVDNGSTDDTPALFDDFPYPFPLRFARNETNQSVIASLNRAARLTDTEFLCFLHNDVEMRDAMWLERLLAALREPDAGLAGLYGIKRLRANGRYVGRTVVHSLAGRPSVRRPWEEVAVVDSVCMCLRRDLFDAIGGLDEGYGFYHGLDRELSFAVRERGRRCLVVYAPFVHHGGGTRARDFGTRPEREREDLSLRAAVLDRFASRYRHRLPCDVRTPGQRLRDWLRVKVARGGASVYSEEHP
jgi:GT2 family glycosyltransferase